MFSYDALALTGVLSHLSYTNCTWDAFFRTDRFVFCEGKYVLKGTHAKSKCGILLDVTLFSPSFTVISLILYH